MLISNFWHVLAAVSPGLLILFYIYKQDIFPEPRNIVFKTFIFGATIILALDLILVDVDSYAEKYFEGEAFNDHFRIYDGDKDEPLLKQIMRFWQFNSWQSFRYGCHGS